MPWAAVLPAYANAHHPTMHFRSCNLLPPLRSARPTLHDGWGLPWRGIGDSVAGMSATLHCNGWEIISCPSVDGWIAIGTRHDRDPIVAIETTEGNALLEIQRQIRIIAG